MRTCVRGQMNRRALFTVRSREGIGHVPYRQNDTPKSPLPSESLRVQYREARGRSGNRPHVLPTRGTNGEIKQRDEHVSRAQLAPNFPNRWIARDLVLACPNGMVSIRTHEAGSDNCGIQRN